MANTSDIVNANPSNLGSNLTENKGLTTAESEHEKLAKKKIDGEVWNVGSKQKPSNIDLDALVERDPNPPAMRDLRKPSIGFSLPKHSKKKQNQTFAGFSNEESSGRTKNFHLPAARIRAATDGLLRATPPIFSPIEVPRIFSPPQIFSPLEMDPGAHLSESNIPESRAKNWDGMEYTQSALAPCTSEAQPLQSKFKPRIDLGDRVLIMQGTLEAFPSDFKMMERAFFLFEEGFFVYAHQEKSGSATQYTKWKSDTLLGVQTLVRTNNITEKQTWHGYSMVLNPVVTRETMMQKYTSEPEFYYFFVHGPHTQLWINAGNKATLLEWMECFKSLWQSGLAPLMIASDEGLRETVEVLLADGADANVKDKMGWTPLTRASARGHHQTVEVLLKHKANINAKDNRGCTPLMQASACGHHETVQVLLAHGADVNAKDKDKLTALEHAKCRSHSKVIQLLQGELDRRAAALSTELDLDPKLELVRLAAENWSSRQPRAVVLRRYDLAGAAISPVWTWQQVTHLTLSNNKLQVLPDLDLPALEHLDVSGNQLEEIATQLLLPKLVHLDLSQNKLRLLPDLSLPALEQVNVSNNKLEKLQTQLLLPKLVDFDLSHNNLTFLPDLDLPALERFNVSNNKLERLKAQLLLPKLVDFNLSHNNLTFLPDLDLPALERFNVSYNELEYIQAQTLSTPKLVDFDQSHNSPKFLPDLDLSALERSKKLPNKHTKLPSTLPPNLVEIDLSHNNLKVLPDLDIATLEHVNISNNQIQDISSEFLPRGLKNLDLSNNDLLDGVAAAVNKLCAADGSLRKLDLKGNHLSQHLPSRIVERGPEAVCQFYKDLTQGRKRCWRQTVLVVGREQAGKTALCHALLGHPCGDHAQVTEASTVGIDTVPWPSVFAESSRRDRKVSCARMVTKDMHFKESEPGAKLHMSPWIKADIELHGPTLTLSCKSSKASSERQTRFFHIQPGISCTSKSNLHFKVKFNKNSKVHLKFPNKHIASAWLNLLTGATAAGNAVSAQFEWVRNDSGQFQPSQKKKKAINNNEWRLQWVWVLLRDFAGQVVYYDTHKVYIARRSLLVLVVDLRRAHDEDNKQRMCWWLRMIRQRTRSAGGKIESCVVLVGTHKDKLCPSTATASDQREQLWRAQNALITAIDSAFDVDVSKVVANGQVFAVSSCNLDGIGTLTTKIQDLLTDPRSVTLVGNYQPATYFVLDKVVRELAETKPMVTRAELRNACRPSNETGPSADSSNSLQQQQDQLSREYLVENDDTYIAALRYLHDSGTSAWFEDVAPEYVFLRPQWLTKLFAMIELQKHRGKCTLNRASRDYRMLTRQGLLRLSLLRELWKYDNDQPDPARTLSHSDALSLKNIPLNELVSLMCHFGVMREISLPKSSDTSAAGATASASLRGPPSLQRTALNPLLSPMGHDTVFIPCMLDSVWGRDFGEWWEPWYVAPPPGERVMAVRLEVCINHYSSISLMPEILKGVLPHLDLTTEPILCSDGLMMHAKKSQLDSDNDGSMATMLFMRPCEDGFFRVDVSVRRPWSSCTPPAIPLADVGVDQLYSLVSAQGLPRLAETLRANHATGKTLSVLTPEHICTFFHATDDEVACLMPAIQQWEARGVPQQTIGSVTPTSALPTSPLHSMSKQLWVFIRAVADALPQEVSSCSRWLVLSPAMIADEGLPMDDRSDVGWSFADVIEALESQTNLRCARTQHCVNYMEYFAANDKDHHDFCVETQVAALSFSEQSDSFAATPRALIDSYDSSSSMLFEPNLSEQKYPDGTLPPASLSTLFEVPLLTLPSTLASALATTPLASALATTPLASNPLGGSTSDAPVASDSASMPATVSPIAVEDDWIWPEPKALSNDSNNVGEENRWCWIVVSDDSKVGKWTDFSDQSSHQLRLMLSSLVKGPDRKPALRVEGGDSRLSQVWEDLNNHKQQAEYICFDGRHGGLVQIRASTASGWVELCCIRKTEYPWVWNCNKRAPTYARVDVPKDSAEWRRIQLRLTNSLGAELTRLERVQNPHTWDLFHQNCVSQHREVNSHMDFTQAGSAVKELWHASGAIDAICKSKIGFDIRRAYRPSVFQKLKDVFGVGGHVYGYGAYFAAEALYSHWWNTRIWNSKKAAKKMSGGKSEHQLILAHVFTGNCKDYGGQWANTLQWAPDGFHSVCGTENHQQVLPVRLYAAKGDRMAEMLLRKGDVFGKQYVTFQSHQAYPAYVVTYNCPNYLPPNVFISSSPSRTQRPMKWEHKATPEKSWTKYSPKHIRQLTQAFREGNRVVMLEHEGKRWRVDLDKSEQKPVVQPFMRFKRRKVRYVYLDHPSF